MEEYEFFSLEKGDLVMEHFHLDLPCHLCSADANCHTTATQTGVTFDQINLILSNMFPHPAETRPAVQIKVCGAWVAECTKSRLLHWPVWERGFNHVASQCDYKSDVTLSISPCPPTHFLSLYFLHLSSAGDKFLGSLARISINHSLLSFYMYMKQ